MSTTLRKLGIVLACAVAAAATIGGVAFAGQAAPDATPGDHVPNWDWGYYLSLVTA
jgi:hypothetical protein